MAMRLEELEQFKPIRTGYPKYVEKLADLVEILVVSLKDTDKREELGDGSLYIKLQKIQKSFIIENTKKTFIIEKLLLT